MSVALQITEVVLTVIMKVPDIIRVFKELGNGKVKQEHENLAQELCALRKEHERASKTIDALVESQEQLNQTLQLLTELLIVLNSLSSRPWPDLQESIRDVLGQGGLRQDSGVRVNEAPSGLTCAVCRSTYNAHDRRPLIFSSCGHTFCEECLRTENRKSVFRCPSCRQDRDQFRTLKPNFALLDLLEALQTSE
nr:DNA repair protein RAD5-like [Penaeus vannamei]